MIGDRYFKITYLSHVRKSKCPWPLKMRSLRCLEMSGNSIPITRRHVPVERRPEINLSACCSISWIQSVCVLVLFFLFRKASFSIRLSVYVLLDACPCINSVSPFSSGSCPVVRFDRGCITTLNILCKTATILIWIEELNIIKYQDILVVRVCGLVISGLIPDRGNIFSKTSR